jgi:hypothetical protein
MRQGEPSSPPVNRNRGFRRDVARNPTQERRIA